MTFRHIFGNTLLIKVAISRGSYPHTPWSNTEFSKIPVWGHKTDLTSVAAEQKQLLQLVAMLSSTLILQKSLLVCVQAGWDVVPPHTQWACLAAALGCGTNWSRGNEPWCKRESNNSALWKLTLQLLWFFSLLGVTEEEQGCLWDPGTPSSCCRGATEVPNGHRKEEGALKWNTGRRLGVDNMGRGVWVLGQKAMWHRDCPAAWLKEKFPLS